MNKVEQEFLIHCEDDYTDLALLVDLIREHEHLQELKVIKEKCLNLIEKLLSDNLILAGSFMKQPPEIWPKDSKLTIKRIEKEWPDTGVPKAGDIVWFISSGKHL